MALDDPDLPMKGVVPSKEELKEFLTISLRHKEAPDFDASFMLPDGWYRQGTPKGQPDLKDPAEFLPLGVFTPTKDFMPPVVFTIGTRRAPKEGSVAEWLEKQCYVQGLALQRMEVHEFLFGKGIDALALQASDLTPLKMRIVMFEDGGRLFALTGMSPVRMWDTVVATLSLAILTFELLQPKGPTAPLLPPIREK